MKIKQLAIILFTSFFLCNSAFAEGSKFDRWATDAEVTAQKRRDVGITPASVSSIVSSGLISKFQLAHTTETLNVDRIILTTDKPVSFFDCNGTDRNVTLSAEASSTNLKFTIINVSDGAGEDIILRDDTPTTLITFGPGQGHSVSCDGTSWEVWFDNGVKYDGVAKSTIFPLEDDAVTPTIAFGNGDTGFYERLDNRLVIACGGVKRHGIAADYIESMTTYGFHLKQPAGSSIVPVHAFVGDEDTGVGRAAADQLSLIAGAIECQRLVKTDSVIYNLVGVTEQDSVTNGESNTSTTISSDGAAGDNFLTTCQVGDAVLIWSGTTTADYGLYWITTVTDDNNLVVDRALSATDSDIDFYVLRGGILQGPNSLNITGRTSNKPVTFVFTTECDITSPLTTSVLLLDGDNDSENDAIDLQDGTVPGQILYLIAAVDIDTDDTCTINYGDTTCTNCPATVFNKVGENVHLIWTGSTWVCISLQNAL